MKIYILIFISILFITKNGNAQHQIEGRVISKELSEPIFGASVKVQDANISTSTNKDGTFFISLPSSKENHVLLISHLGFLDTKVDLSLVNEGELLIYLENKTSTLEEVSILTGYQSLSPNETTGSFTTVDLKSLNRQVSSDILSRLESVANGVMIDRSGAGPGRIAIRGLSTIRGPKQPLIVLDNFPYSGDINNINPNEIENITILKDAAASSIWGARAGNGVIVITTKKSGFNKPLDVDFNVNLSIGEKPNLLYSPLMASSDFIDVEQKLYNEGFYKSWIDSRYKQVVSPVVELLLSVDENRLTMENANSQINAFRNNDVRDEFLKHFYQNSFSQRYALSINGGSSTTKWIASAGYDNNIDNLNAGTERINLRFNNTFKVLSNLELSSGIYFTNSKTANGMPGFGSINQHVSTILPYVKFADENGNPLPIAMTYRQSFLEQIENKERLLDWNYYPLIDYKNVENNSKGQHILVNADLNYQIVPEISFQTKYQYEVQNVNNRVLSDEDSYFTRDLINGFTEINDFGQVTHNVPVGGILDLTDAQLETHNIRGQLNFARDWNDHQIVALVGSELRLNQTQSNASRYYGYNESNLSFGQVNYNERFMHYIRELSESIPNHQNINQINSNFISYFSNALYKYKNKYLFSLSARKDASNLFGLNVNDQWNPFWSTGISWVVSNEDFFDKKSIDYLKFRITYGSSGNIDPAMSAFTTIRYAGNSAFTNHPQAIFSNYYNPELKWETAKTVNLGMDFSLKNDRIGGSLEYFHKRGDDLFGSAFLDYTTGINSIVKNVASMKGRGLDLALRTVNINRSFKWETMLNLSIYKDQIVDYYTNNSRASDYVSRVVSITGIKGKPVYSVFAYRWGGLDPEDGDPLGYHKGVTSKDYSLLINDGTALDDLKFYGSAIPTKYGSLGNTFSYKNWELNFAFSYKLGYYFRQNSISYSSLFTNWEGHSDFSKRWQVTGDESYTDVPSMQYPADSNRDSFYAGSEPLVHKGDHLRFQYINLNYVVNRSKIPFLPVDNIQFYLNASNLGIIWRANSKNIDPDVGSGLYNLTQPKSFSIGFRVRY